ncbi:MAG: hypothetical protein JRJ47_02215 [Deltaproteobacteria bacterium]|nr:hypothetical protein [Deltaproteobacteria bacterium]
MKQHTAVSGRRPPVVRVKPAFAKATAGKPVGRFPSFIISTRGAVVGAGFTPARAGINPAPTFSSFRHLASVISTDLFAEVPWA